MWFNEKAGVSPFDLAAALKNAGKIRVDRYRPRPAA